MFMLACVSSLQWSDASFTGSYHRFTNKIWETRKTGGFGPQCSQETCIWLDNMIHIHKYSEYVCWHPDNTRDTRIQFKYKTSHYGIRSFAKCRNMSNKILIYATDFCWSCRECKASSWTHYSQHVRKYCQSKPAVVSETKIHAYTNNK